MNDVDDNDSERALFEQELREEKAAGRLETSVNPISKHVFLLPGETRFESASLRKMVKHRNEMVQLLREFLALHPEDTSLTRRARRFTGRKRPSDV